MADRDLIGAARGFVDAAAGADVEIFVRNGPEEYGQMLRGAPELVGALLARIAELEQPTASPKPAPKPGLPVRECHRCGRRGKRLYIRTAEGWECSAWAACKERVIQREAAANA